MSYIMFSHCYCDNTQKLISPKKKFSDLNNVDFNTGVEQLIASEFKLAQVGAGTRLDCGIRRVRSNMDTFPFLNVKWQVRNDNYSYIDQYHDQEMNLMVDDHHRLILLDLNGTHSGKFVCFLNDKIRKVIHLSVEKDISFLLNDLKPGGYFAMLIVLFVILSLTFSINHKSYAL